MEPNYPTIGGASRETEVFAQMNVAEKGIDLMLQKLETLEVRLASVLRASAPEEATKSGLEQTTNTQLGARIQSIASGLNRASNRLGELLIRLEI